MTDPLVLAHPDVTVTAVPLGTFVAPYDLLDGMSAADAVRRLTACGHAADGTVHAHAFVVATDEATILLDAGMGAGSALPGLAPGLVAAGVEAADVDTVLITHLHPDHANGLLDGGFAHATVVVPDAEIAFAREAGTIAAGTEFTRTNYARAAEVLDHVADRLVPLSAWPGLDTVHAEALPGHSPGHTGYRLRTGASDVLFVGDLVHFPELQAPRPDVSVIADLDARLAARTRARVFADAAADGTVLAGAHVGARPFHRVQRRVDGYELAAP